MNIRVRRSPRLVGIVAALVLMTGILVIGVPASAQTTSSASVAACGGAGSVPLDGRWHHLKANTSVTGYPGYRQGYRGFIENSPENASIAVQVKGWEGSELKWYGLGATGGDFSGHVPWGYSLATPEIRVLNTGFYPNPMVRFNC